MRGHQWNCRGCGGISQARHTKSKSSLRLRLPLVPFPSEMCLDGSCSPLSQDVSGCVIASQSHLHGNYLCFFVLCFGGSKRLASYLKKIR